MKKGIIIYAIGHPNYYYMAENLAASLISNRSQIDEIGITLICDNKQKVRYPDLFDEFIVLEKEKFMVEDKVVFNNATVLAYDLSPYDITMKLDADMIWLGGRPVSHLFNELKDVKLTFSNLGPAWGKGNSQWTTEEEMMKAYKLNSDDHKLYKIFGEFVYFKKVTGGKKYFDKVKSIYNKPKVQCKEFANGTMTDELAFQIACMLTGMYPHADNYTPVLNQILGLKEFDRYYPYQLPPTFYGYSLGGNLVNNWIKKGYDNLARHYFNQLGLQTPYHVSNKNPFYQKDKNYNNA